MKRDGRFSRSFFIIDSILRIMFKDARFATGKWICMMKVLVIGRSGRGHALLWKLKQSPRVKQVFCAPGNAGTALDGVNVPIEANDFERFIKWAKKEEIGL